MKSLPLELILVLVFAGLVLIQLLMKLRRRPAPPQAHPETGVPSAPRADPSDMTRGGSRVVPVDWSAPVEAFAEQLRHPRTTPLAQPGRPVRRCSRHALLGTKRDVQNAVVVATILGPCRALERPGGAEVGASIRRARR